MFLRVLGVVHIDCSEGPSCVVSNRMRVNGCELVVRTEPTLDQLSEHLTCTRNWLIAKYMMFIL